MAKPNPGKLYRQLAPHEKQFIQEKQIKGNFKVREWLSLLHKSAAYDAAGDEMRQKILKWIIVAAVVMFFSLFIFPPLALVGLPVLIFLIVRRVRLSKRDLTNHLRLFVMPFLKVLSDKAGDRTRLKMELDFRPAKKHGKKDTRKVPNRTINRYQPQWAKAEAELMDGSSLYVFLVDDYDIISQKKRTTRGKTKYKTKYKIVNHLLIKMVLPAENYTLRENLPEELETEVSDQQIAIKLKGKIKTREKDTVYPFPEYLKAMELVYASVIPSEKLLKQLPAETTEQDEERPEADEGVSPEVLGAAAGVAAVPFLMWSTGYFDDYDYDSFDSSEAVAFGVGGEDSVFDS